MLTVWTLSIIQSGYQIQFRVPPRLMISPHASGSCQDGNFEWRSGSSTSKERDRRSNEYIYKERLLQPHFPSTKEIRLVSTFCLIGSIMASQQKALVNNSGPRFYSQLGKVRASSSSGSQFPRCSIPASISPYQPLSGQHYLPSASNHQDIRRQAKHRLANYTPLLVRWSL